jgi:hypothetical protein
MRSILIKVFLVVVLTSTVDGSRFFGVLAAEGKDFTQNGVQLDDIFGAMIQQGQVHEDGWGLVYYMNGKFGYSVAPNEYIPTPSGPIFRSPLSAYEDSYNVEGAVWEMRWGGFETPDDYSDGVTCAISHVRLASSGCGSEEGEETTPANPHPFIRTIDGITYAFAHNGTLDKDVLRTLITVEWMFENDFHPQTFGEYGCGGLWWVEEGENAGWDHVVDSELYFFWILKNILEDPARDVLRGIHKALSNDTFRSLDANKNFILTDGDEIWSFRAVASDDDNTRTTLTPFTGLIPIIIAPLCPRPLILTGIYLPTTP